MNITLKNVKMLAIAGDGADTICIYAENIKDGAYPFEGPQMLRALIAKNTAKTWIKSNFPEIEMSDIDFIDTSR